MDRSYRCVGQGGHRPYCSPGWWCFADDCPSVICNGPHKEVETSLGTEILRYDQEPIGTPTAEVRDANGGTK